MTRSPSEDHALATDFPSGAWVADLRARGSAPAFADARAALDARVEAYHDTLPDLPERQAGYYHDFFCPDHAVQLVFNPRDGHHHACPIDGRTYSGEPFDSAWGWSVNDALSDAALRSALRRALGHVPGRADADAALLRPILLGYAARYRTMPPAPAAYPGEYAGRVCWSALDESVWIIRLAWAVALARDAFSRAELTKLADGLFRPGLEHLQRVRYRQIQNVGNWDRGAILTLGLLLGDEATVTTALDEEYGVRDQLARGVTADGLWWELSLSYHFYVLGAVAWTMRALRAAGRSFDREDAVRRMFQAPLDLAFPDATLPATNDCWYHIGLTGEVGHGIPNADGFYEMAFGWFGEPLFAWVVGENRRRNGVRATMEALLDGALDIPAVKRGPTRSRHFGDSGLSMLRAGSGPTESAVLVKASTSDGDAHGHPDQLGLTAFAGGRRLAIDPGTPGYGIPLNDTWYRQSAAHSTVLLDSASQPPTAARFNPADAATADAEVAWPSGGEWPGVVDRAREIQWPQEPSAAYAGATMRRLADVGESSIDDRFEVRAPVATTIDWLFHVTGELDAPTQPAADALRGPCGYDELRDVRRVVAGGGRLTFRHPGGDVTLLVEPIPGEDLFVASAPGNPAADRHSLLVRRVHGAEATFMTRIEWASSSSSSA